MLGSLTRQSIPSPLSQFQFQFIQQNPMGEMRLDFNAPLLSVRRIAAKADSRPETVGSPGVVPFTWEQTPGRPKGPALAAPKPPPGRIEFKKVVEKDDGAETFSRSDSSLDCSVSGCSGDDVEPSERFSKDPEVQELLMGRFLPAARAVATGPLVTATSKAPQSRRIKGANYRRSPVPLPYQHRPSALSKFASDHMQEEDVSYGGDENEDEEYGGGSHFSRACGLIPRSCLKSSFLLLNPVPGMKVRSYLPLHSQISSVSDHGSVGHADDESWDMVYRSKRDRRDDPLENETNLTNESNQLTCWSDSQMIDESLYRRSPQLPFLEGKGSVGVLRRDLKGRKTVSFDWCERVGEKYGKMNLRHGKKQGASSMSPSIDRTLCGVHSVESPSSKSSSVDTVAGSADENSGIVVNGQKMDCNPVLEAGLSSSTERSNSEGLNCSNKGQLALKAENKEKNGAYLALSLLPPLLLKSPSESWLQRTLPAVSSKNPSSQSLLGIQVQHRKQVSWAPLKDFNWENDSTALKRLPQQTRFAQVVTKHTALQWEP